MYVHSSGYSRKSNFHRASFVLLEHFCSRKKGTKQFIEAARSSSDCVSAARSSTNKLVLFQVQVLEQISSLLIVRVN